MQGAQARGAPALTERRLQLRCFQPGSCCHGAGGGGGRHDFGGGADSAPVSAAPGQAEDNGRYSHPVRAAILANSSEARQGAGPPAAANRSSYQETSCRRRTAEAGGRYSHPRAPPFSHPIGRQDDACRK
ncbi:hypothetical protein NDU88_008907 [Pleurodeles waltl]|uniref:Uncharacterized protein n=1 Tax=Pleurodeles waltl TaxID=8319 RepID=A0AAV7NFK7_PLEWA|nr:hypothetical protein NDU88_008907 [Pleurodeles waltl]